MIRLEEYLNRKKILVEDYIKEILSVYSCPHEDLARAIEYGLLAGGKRFRPILSLAAAEAAGGNEEFVLPAACAVEFIHNYSLIHDDLPCMDNDDYRRGKLSCHKKFDEATALLAGDGLLTLAFEVVSDSYASYSIHSSSVLRVIKELAQACGIRGMVGGQALDLMTPCNKKLANLEKLHKMKTGALIIVSVRIGALLSNAPEEHLEAFTAYAERLGFTYQIVDDILDFDKDEEINSFLSVYSIEESKEHVLKLTQEAVKYLEPLGAKAERLRQIAWYFAKRSY